MLRPARLLGPWTLSTPRSADGVSPDRLGPATRRSDAYRDGTLTRWRSAASGGRTFPLRGQLFRRVTTHHVFIVAEVLAIEVTDREPRRLEHGASVGGGACRRAENLLARKPKRTRGMLASIAAASGAHELDARRVHRIRIVLKEHQRLQHSRPFADLVDRAHERLGPTGFGDRVVVEHGHPRASRRASTNVAGLGEA